MHVFIGHIKGRQQPCLAFCHSFIFHGGTVISYIGLGKKFLMFYMNEFLLTLWTYFKVVMTLWTQR